MIPSLVYSFIHSANVEWLLPVSVLVPEVEQKTLVPGFLGDILKTNLHIYLLSSDLLLNSMAVQRTLHNVKGTPCK